MKKRAFILSIAIVFTTAIPLATSENLKIKEWLRLSHKTSKLKTEERTKATMAEKKANRKMAKAYAFAGWGWKNEQWKCLDKLLTKEARYDHLAKNQQGSSAFGIGQRLKETSKDPATQLLKTYRYIAHRFDTPCRAWKFHQRHNYY